MDLLAALIALFAVRVSGRRADKEHPFGHGKVENISGSIEAFLIFAVAAWIIYEATRKLFDPHEIEMPFWGVGVMAVSVVVNILVSRRLFKVGEETDSVALRADAWHLRTDVYTSTGVMVGLLVIWVGGWVWPEVDLRWIDPVVAILVALMIMRAAWNLTRESTRDLLDVSLPDRDIEWIPGFVKGRWPAVRSLHHIRTRKAGPYRFVDLHLVVDDHMSVGESHALGDEIVVAIKERLPQVRVQIHVEPCEVECAPACESGCVVEPGEREVWRGERSSGREERGAGREERGAGHGQPEVGDVPRSGDR